MIRWTLGSIWCFMCKFWKKHWVMQRKGKEFTSFNANWTLDNLLCNCKRRAWVISSITFVKIVKCWAFKYRSPFDVVITLLIKTIEHWFPLYASKSWYYVLKWPKTRTFWSNSPSPFAINNCFHLCYPLFPLHQWQWQQW